MEFKITTKDNKTITLDTYQLLDILLGEVLEVQKAEFAVLGERLSHYLQQRGTLGELTINQIFTTTIALGYYYKVFMDKNDVTITAEATAEATGENKDELANESSPEPPSETSSL